MQKVFLIGLSGSGKSTVSQLLANRLHLPLLDIDKLIELEYGERIPAIFAQYGEEYFRTCESSVLAKVVQAEGGAVIATGGGIVISPENRAIMAKQGLRVYLEVEPATALERLQAQYAKSLASGETPELRPLLQGDNTLARLQQLLESRAGWYKEADFICSTQQKSLEQIVQEVIAMLISTGELEVIPPITRHLQVGEGYDAVVDWGGLGRLSTYLKQLQLPSRIFLITDSNLDKLYLPGVISQLTQSGFEPLCYTIPAGEASKSQNQLYAIYDWLLDQHAERREAIVAIGGGVVGDLVGFAASTYLRSVPLVQVPTSLLAQVDAAIGGKTGINHPRGKNLIGSFYHPRLVLADPATLLTLPVRERTEGWAEIVKYGIILDIELFERLEKYASILRDFSPPPAALFCEIIARCIDLKAAIIEEDEREGGRRAILNYGHTVAHALENVAGYGEWLHGEAVSLGMVAAATLAQQAGMFSQRDVERQNQLLKELGLPVVYSGKVRAQDILSAIQLDKKVASKRVRWIMPQQIGKVISTTLPDELVERVLTAFFSE